jgi:aminomethyltransferase
MVDFAGYDMPLQYSGIRDEHLAVRDRAGMFDVSHMGEVLVHGAGASEWLQGLVTNNVARLDDGQALYTVMCKDDGGILDDLIIYRGDASHFLVIVNASTREKDIAWMNDHVAGGVTLHDASEDLALLAIQGPRAVDILEPLVSLDGGASLREMKAFATSGATITGVPDAHNLRVSRTGYTGEDGFEIVVDSGGAGELWDVLLAAGAPYGLLPAGLGARDTLRLEAGLRLYGQDMDETTDPYSVGLGWTVKLDKGDFIGRDVLEARRDAPLHRFIGLRLGPRSIARHGHAVFQDEVEIGTVTSGTFGFTVGTAVAMASVDPDFQRGGAVAVDIRGTEANAEVVPLPFYKRHKGDG